MGFLYFVWMSGREERARRGRRKEMKWNIKKVWWVWFTSFYHVCIGSERRRKERFSWENELVLLSSVREGEILRQIRRLPWEKDRRAVVSVTWRGNCAWDGSHRSSFLGWRTLNSLRSFPLSPQLTHTPQSKRNLPQTNQSLSSLTRQSLDIKQSVHVNIKVSPTQHLSLLISSGFRAYSLKITKGLASDSIES